MDKNMRGTKVPVVIHVDGLDGGKHLTDTNVDVEAIFYCKHPRINLWEEIPTVKYNKSQMVPESQGASDDLVCIVDTTSLDYGVLTADIKVSYPTQYGQAQETLQATSDLYISDRKL